MEPGERLEGELRRALHRLGVGQRTVESVMASGCRLDGIGAAALEPELAAADARLRDRVRDLAAALDRCSAGSYGRCEQCGKRIGTERLELLPTTTRCRSCADG